MPPRPRPPRRRFRADAGQLFLTVLKEKLPSRWRKLLQGGTSSISPFTRTVQASFEFADVTIGPRLARAVGSAGAQNLQVGSDGLTDEGSLAMAAAVAAAVADGSLRRLLILGRTEGPARLLTHLGAAHGGGGAILRASGGRLQ